MDEQLNKLIEQYKEEKHYAAHEYVSSGYRFTGDFVQWLASRPTCGKEQRKFLDEVEKLMDVPESGFIQLNEIMGAYYIKVIRGE